jgi:phosphatidate cytidylyltransferase
MSDDRSRNDRDPDATNEQGVLPGDEQTLPQGEAGEAPLPPPPSYPPPEDPSGSVRIISGTDEPPLRFGSDDTGPLPHWTEPPTGEVPKVLLDDSSTDDLDAWSNLSSGAPVWRDDRTRRADEDLDFESFVEAARVEERRPDPFFDEFDEPSGPPSKEQPRVTPIRTRTANRRLHDEESGFTASGGTGGRNMPVAIAAGVGIAALALFLFWLGARFAMVLVVAILVLSGVELYEKLRERGYQPATLAGLTAIAGLPLAAYWRGDAALPLVVFLAIAATLLWFILSGGLESGPLPNTAVTMLGVTLVGVLGSYAALILRGSDGVSLLLLTALGVVAYDIGGLFVGSAAGRTQLVPWISPNKTVEGLIGGVVAVFLVVVLGYYLGISVYSESFLDAVKLAAVIMVTAPIGDLAASMLKRNLDVKDFGTLLPGHGGVLDRFCSFLLVLPAVYYLTLTLSA